MRPFVGGLINLPPCPLVSLSPPPLWSPEEYCSEEMFVELLYKEGTVEDTFSVPLCDIEAIDADPKTQAAIADWHYWVDQGYQF